MSNSASRPLIFSQLFLYFVLPARIALKGNWRMPVTSDDECLGSTVSGQSQGREAKPHRIRESRSASVGPVVPPAIARPPLRE